MTSGYTTDQQSSCLSKAAFIIALFQERKHNCERALVYHQANREACLKRMATRRAALKQAELAKTLITNAFLTLFFSWCLLKMDDNTRRRKVNRKRWAKNNPEKISVMRSKRNKVRRATDPNWKLRKTYRDQIYHALKGNRKSAKGRALLGCTFEFFRAYIENQFQPGWTWENHGTVWELDHILPCAEFHLQHSEEQEICFHWTNFQPLSVSDNRTKGDKVL